MGTNAPAYGLWLLAAVNAALFIAFALSFYRPQSRRDWRSFGAFSAFLVALFAEMYGFPLTIFLLSGWLQARWPEVDWLSHDAGHLAEALLGWRVNPHFGPFHVLSLVFISGGFWLLARAWPILYHAQQHGVLATQGPYARIRHPQYAGFMLIMTGFLLQWPTLVTLAMFPILVTMYVRLARKEDREAAATFGAVHQRYAEQVPAFLPRRGSHRTGVEGGRS